MADLKLLLEIIGKDSASREIAHVAQSLDQLDGKASGAGNALATIATGATVAGLTAVAAGIGASIVAATGFEAQMSAVKAVMAPDEVQAFGGALQDLALTLGAETSFSAMEAAQGLEELVKAGVKVEDLFAGAARASLDLAAAGGIKVGEAAEIASAAMNNFGLKGADMAHVADVIAGAANSSAISVNDFKFSMSAVGAVANLAGQDFEQTATAIALMGNAGIKGSDAGTSLKTMLMNLIPTSNRARDAFRDWGLTTVDASGNVVNAFVNADGSFKNLNEIAGALKTSLGAVSEAERSVALEAMFGADAIRAAAILTQAGAEGFDALGDSIAKVTAQAVATERLNNLKGALEQLKGSVETAAITIGLEFTPVLQELVQSITPLVNDAMPGLKTGAAAIATAFRVAIPVLREFFVFLGEHKTTIAAVVAALATFAILSTVVSGITAVVAAVGALSAAFGAIAAGGGALAVIVGILGGPVTLAILAVAAVVGVLTAAWLNNWGDIQGKTAAVAEFIGEHGDTIKTVLTMLLGPLGALKVAWDTNWGDIQGKTGAVVTFVKDGVESWGAIFDATGTLIHDFTTGVATAWETMQTALSAVLDWLGERPAAVWTAMGDMLSGVLEAMRTKVTEIWTTAIPEDIRDSLAAIKTNVEERWQGMQTFIGDRLRDILTAVTEKWQAVATFIRDRLTDLQTGIEEKWAGFLTFISDTAEAIRAALAGKWAEITAAASAAFTAIAAGGGALAIVVALLGGPVTVAILAISVAVGLLAAAWLNNWGDIQGKTAAVVAFVKDGLESWAFVFDTTGTMIANFGKGIGDTFDALGTLIHDTQEAISTGLRESWTGMQTAVSAVLDWLGERPEAVWTGIRDMMGDVLGAIHAKLTEIWTNAIPEDIRNDLNAIKTNIEERWQGFQTFIGDRLTDIKTTVEETWTGLTTFISDRLTAIQTVVEERWQGIQDFIRDRLRDIQTGLEEKWTGFLTFISDRLTAIKTAVEERWQGMQTFIGDRLRDILTAVTEKWQAVATFIGDRLTDIKTTVEETWTGLTTFISDRLTAIQTAVDERWQGIQDFIRDRLGDIQTGLEEKWTGFLTFISDRLTAIQTVVEERWQGIQDFIRDRLGDIQTGLEEKWTGFLTFISDRLTAIQTTLEEKWTGFTTFISDRLTAIKTAVEERWQGIQDFIRDRLRDIQTGLEEKWAGFLTFISDTAEAIRAALAGKWAEITAATATAWEAVRTTIAEWLSGPAGALLVVTTWADNVMSELGTLASNALAGATTIGGNVVSGITGGISGAWQGFTDFLGGKVRDFLGLIKTALGIGSPSTVMAAIGGELIAGLQQGMGNAVGGFFAWLKTNVIDPLPQLVKDLLNIRSPSGVFVEIGGQIIAGLIKGLQDKLPSLQGVIGGIGGALGSLGQSPSGNVPGGIADTEISRYIAGAAAARGIDAMTALRVAMSEGGVTEPARLGDFSGPPLYSGKSWWPFQLHYGGRGYEQYGSTAGMGNSFTAETGFRPGDAAAWRASVDYALDHAKRAGWGAWYGASAQGITGFQGITRNLAGGEITGPMLGIDMRSGRLSTYAEDGRRERVLSHDDTAAYERGSGRAITVTINHYGPGELVPEQVVRALRRAELLSA